MLAANVYVGVKFCQRLGIKFPEETFPEETRLGGNLHRNCAKDRTRWCICCACLHILWLRNWSSAKIILFILSCTQYGWTKQNSASPNSHNCTKFFCYKNSRPWRIRGVFPSRFLDIKSSKFCRQWRFAVLSRPSMGSSVRLSVCPSSFRRHFLPYSMSFHLIPSPRRTRRNAEN